MRARRRWAALSLACAALSPGCGAQAPARGPETARTADVQGDRELGSDDPERPDQERQVTAIEKALGERGPGVYECRSAAAADDLRVDGEVILALTLEEGGRVAKVEVARDTAGDEVLARCLVKLWDGYQFETSFERGDVVRLPPFKFVSEGRQYAVHAGHVAPVTREAARVASLLTEQNTGNPGLELEMIHLPPGKSVELGGEHDESEVLYVFVGSAAIRARGLPGGKARAGLGTALYAPAANDYVLRNPSGTDDLVLIRFNVPAVREPRRGITVKEPGETETLSIAGGKARVQVYFDAAGKHRSLYFGQFHGKPGLKVPEHVHGGETESLFVLAGEARMSVEGKAFPIGPGDAVQVPPNTRHAAEVMGEDAFIALQVYTPSGPEQRFRGGEGESREPK